MAQKPDLSTQLRKEAQELRETAIDLIEHAAMLIAKSTELDKQIAKNFRGDSSRKK